MSATFTKLHDLPGTCFVAMAKNNSDKIAVAVYGDYIYTSNDGGITLTKITATGARNWVNVSIDDSGTNIVASAGRGQAYWISHDFGTTWTHLTGPDGDGQIKVNSNGDYFLISGSNYFSNSNSGIYVSADGGYSLIQKASGVSVQAIEISSSGQYMFYFVSGTLYVSTNFGVSFTASAATFSGTLRDIAVDLSGQYVVVTTSGNIYTSSDFGTTFILHSGGADYLKVSSDFTGAVLGFISQTPTEVNVSYDFGSTLVLQTVIGATTWKSIASNFDGTVYVFGSDTSLWSGSIPNTATPPIDTQQIVITNPITTITTNHKTGIGTVSGTPNPTTPTTPPHGGTPKIVIPPLTPISGGGYKISVTNPDGTVVYASGTVSSSILLPGGNDTMTVRVDGSVLTILFNGKVIITYLLTPQLFPDLFTNDGWIGWVDNTNTVIDGATPTPTIAPLTGYKYNFNGRIFDSPIGYDSLMLLRGKQWRGVGVLFRQDGSHYSSEEVENVDIINAKKYYWGGRDYQMYILEATTINNAGYGSYLTDIS